MSSRIPVAARAVVMCLALVSAVLCATASRAGDPLPPACETTLAPYLVDANEAAIRTYFGVDPTKPIDILAFDHRAQTWSACTWTKGSSLKSMGKDLGRRPDGAATLRRRGHDQFLLAIVHTNPFLYTHDAAALPPVDAAGVANLKTLASAIAALAPTIMMPTLGPAGVLPVKGQGREEPNPASQIPDLVNKLVLFVQKLELGEGGAFTEGPGFAPAEVNRVAIGTPIALNKLAREHADLSPKVRGCAAQWAVVTALLKRTRLTAEDLKAVRADFYKAGAQAPGACADTTPRDALDTLVPAAAGETLTQAQKELLDDPAVKDASRMLAIEEVLSQRKTVEAGLAQLAGFARIADRMALRVGGDDDWDPQLLNAGVAIATPSFEAQHWDKDYPGTLTIKPDASLCADCTRVRASVDKRSFTLASRADSFLGVGFGVTYTRITDPTFGKVSVDPTGQTKGLVIGRSSEESRAGLLTVLGIVRPWPLVDAHHRRGPVEPGIEFGAGVDPKKPAGFLGVSVEFFKVLRLGIGATVQSVTALDRGLTAATFGPNGVPLPGTGSPLSADGDLRTRKGTAWGPYFSLVVGLDSLPFFGAKKGS